MLKACLTLSALILAGSASAQSTTNCYQAGAIVSCSTQAQPQASVPAPDLNSLLHAGESAGRSFAQGQQRAQQQALDRANLSLQQQQLQQQAADASAQRRAAAYTQVGQLIAAGQCDRAKALAAFYNHPDIIADTAKACP